MTTEERVSEFQAQMLCGNPVYLWRYGPERRVLDTNCPEREVFHEAFCAFGCYERAWQHMEKNAAPMMLGSPIGLEWAAVGSSPDGELECLYVLGPVLTTDVSINGMRWALHNYEQFVRYPSWSQKLLRAVEQLSVIMRPILMQYALMLHCCVTGETLRASDVYWQPTEKIGDSPSPKSMRDRDVVYRGERAILRMVREGDLNYKWAMNNSHTVSDGIPVTGNDPLRQAKTSVIVFTSLCVREAIAGGLSPDQAYQLGDQYIQSVEDCSSIEQIGAYSSTMYADFIERVHKCRTNLDVSRQIRACCDYIELHAEDDISIETLAEQAGYSKYYLSRKFKEEMGATVTEYIKAARVERAKLLLAATELSIQEIAEKLHFCSRSYFSTVFLQTAGCTPTEYRERGENT